VTISQTGDIFSYSLPDDATITTLKEFVQAESGIAVATQQFYLNGQLLPNDTQTLSASGVTDGDLIAVQVRQQQQATPQRAQPSQNMTQVDQQAESTRQQLLNNTQMRDEFLRQMPSLTGALYNPAEFRDAFRRMHEARAAEESRYANLDNNITEENQAEVEKRIRMQLIEQHRQEAMEEHPERTHHLVFLSLRSH